MFRRPNAMPVQTNGNGNGHGDGHAGGQLIAPEEPLVIEETADPDKKKGKDRKLPLWPFAVLAVVLLAVVVVAALVARGVYRKTEMNVAVEDPAAAAAKKTEEQRKAADAQLNKLTSSAAIEEARRDVPPEVAPSPGAAPSPSPAAGTAAIKGYPYAANGAGVPPGAAGTVPSQTTAATQAGAQTSAQPATAQSAGSSSSSRARENAPTSAANTQQSFRYKPLAGAARAAAETNYTRAAADGFDDTYSFTERGDERRDGRAARRGAPVVPPFGTMLPVRTMGALYTLRAGGLARLELTRDVTGKGWALARGTVLVAKVNASDVDRVFLTVNGFIDPQTGNLVRVGGDVLGQDGGTGLKGKRRVVGSAWVRAAAKVSAGGLELLQSIIAGRNGGTTVITGGQDALTSELSGIQQRNQRREFVEVQAGTFGYVMVSDLPPDERGQLPDLAGAQQPDAGQLSDDEIAALLTSGTPEQIRAALPRMGANLRVVAESLLKQSGN